MMVMVNYENVNEGDHKWKWEGELEVNEEGNMEGHPVSYVSSSFYDGSVLTRACYLLFA